MARRPEGDNSIDETVAKRWFGELRRVHEDLDAQKIRNMNDCKAIRDRRPKIFEQAEAAGIPMKALKIAEKQWLEERRILEARARQQKALPEDADDLEIYEQLQRAIGAFGNTPLGAAALKKADPAAKGADPEEVRPPHLIRLDDERRARTAEAAAVEENTERLEKGIKPTTKGMPGSRKKDKDS